MRHLENLWIVCCIVSVAADLNYNEIVNDIKVALDACCLVIVIFFLIQEVDILDIH